MRARIYRRRRQKQQKVESVAGLKSLLSENFNLTAHQNRFLDILSMPLIMAYMPATRQFTAFFYSSDILLYSNFMNYCSDIAEAQTLARKVFPDLADVAFELPPQSKQNFVLIHNQEVIRIARHEWAAKTMQRESEILHLLEDGSPVPIPRFLGLYPDSHIMRTTRVAGRHLSAEEIQKLSERQIQNIAEQLAGFMAYMHEGLALSDEQKTEFQDDTSYFHSRVFPRIEKLLKQDLQHDQRKLLEKAKCYLESYDALPDDIVLTHGDLIFGNILYDDQTGDIGIVDFTGASTSYRHLDFKKMLSYPEPFLKSVLKEYKEKTGHDVDIDLTKTAYCLNSSYNWKPELKQPPRFVL